MRNFNRGLTILEIIVVVAIVAFLATLAIPYYQGYVVRAKLTEVEHAMTLVKSAVSAYRQEKEDAWPHCPSINEVRNSLGVGLGAVTRVSSLSIDGATGVITATVTHVHPMVDGKTITLTPELTTDGSFRWTWGWSEDFPLQYRPKSPR